MIDMVVGFMFSLDSEKVVLLRKQNKPAWMHNMLNGVGGKIEPGETPEEAMVREFREETTVEHTDWKRAGALYMSSDAVIHLFFTHTEKWKDVQSPTIEPVAAYDVRFLFQEYRTVPNLHWLIPYLLQFEESGSRAVSAFFGGTHTNGAAAVAA